MSCYTQHPLYSSSQYYSSYSFCGNDKTYKDWNRLHPYLPSHNTHSTAAASITAVTLSLARTRHTRTEICCVHVLLHTTHTKAATNIMTDHPQHCLWPTGRSTLTNAGCVHVWLQHTLYTTAASIAADHPQHSLASRQGHIDWHSLCPCLVTHTTHTHQQQLVSQHLCLTFCVARMNRGKNGDSVSTSCQTQSSQTPLGPVDVQ